MYPNQNKVATTSTPFTLTHLKRWVQLMEDTALQRWHVRRLCSSARQGFMKTWWRFWRAIYGQIAFNAKALYTAWEERRVKLARWAIRACLLKADQSYTTRVNAVAAATVMARRMTMLSVHGCATRWRRKAQLLLSKEKSGEAPVLLHIKSTSCSSFENDAVEPCPSILANRRYGKPVAGNFGSLLAGDGKSSFSVIDELISIRAQGRRLPRGLPWEESENGGELADVL